MKRYMVVLKKFGQTVEHDNFLSLQEVKTFLIGQGFKWCPELNKWEQTYETVDPYSDAADDLFIHADVIAIGGVALAG
ncbi:hypothetical protein HED42_08870 [Enterococcus casseliflavus]|uniref:hypothetical protein n=1 Tax=Enterococcus casseliflavus TaxID=37734 RepID=UPI0014329F01|nr:hypothetical protein [Enterococcus casseliflavus]NKD38243.1 hypothetical protein [Enterococcus casseliflavus]